jgi:hypothetical protein
MTHAFRFISAGVLVAAFAACTSVNPVASPWATYIVNKQPTTIWLTRTNRSVVRVDGPRVFHDTIIGAVQGQYTEIPLSDVTRVSAMRSDKTKTILAATAGGVATVGALVFIFRGQGGSQVSPPCDPDTPCGPGTP